MNTDLAFASHSSCDPIILAAHVAPVFAVTFAPPTDDAGQRLWGHLPVELREDTRLKLEALEVIDCAKNRRFAIVQIARSHDGELGWSKQRLEKQYYDYRSTGDWTLVVDQRRAGATWRDELAVAIGDKVDGDRKAVPEETVRWIRGLAFGQQRTIKGAIRRAHRIWKTHQDPRPDHNGLYEVYQRIPGYTEWPKADDKGKHPAGWSPRNLYDRCKITPFEDAATKQGRGAARNFRLPVKTTSVGLKFGAIFQTDDKELDFNVNLLGQIKAMRPRGFAMIEGLTRSITTALWKPTFWDLEESRKKALLKRDYHILIIHHLLSTGYRNDDNGTLIVDEKGTAHADEEFAKRVFDATGGKVRFDHGAIDRRQAHAGQFKGPARGNPQHKPLIEGYWRILTDAMADLPGQVGKDRNHAPEQNEALMAYNEKIVGAMLVKPEWRELLQTPVLWWPMAQKVINAIMEEIDAREDHAIEGWEENGFVQFLWRATRDSSDWLPMAALESMPDAARTALSSMISADASLRMVRKMSPAAARRKMCRIDPLTQLPIGSLPLLFSEAMAHEYGHPVRVTADGLIEFDDSAVSPDTLGFIAFEGGKRLGVGEKFLAFFDQMAPDRGLALADARLRVVGVCPAYPRVLPTDKEGLTKIKRMAEADEALQLAAIQRDTRPAAIRAAAMHVHNAQAMQGATPGQRARQQRADHTSKEIISDLAERARESGVGQTSNSPLEQLAP